LENITPSIAAATQVLDPGYDGTSSMSATSLHPGPGKHPAATAARIVLAFASVYIFWGSTYTAIRVGVTQMPPLLLAGTRFLIAGAILLAWCRWRRLRLVWPPKDMLLLALIGLLLLGAGNVGLVYAEHAVPSGLASLLYAVIPLYVALIEMFLPGGEPLPVRGWLGMALGFAGLVALLWPSLRHGLAGDRARLWAIVALLAGALCWSVGSVVSRRARLRVNSFVAAAWQMLAAGACSTILGTLLGQWPRFHLNSAALWSQAYLIACGSLLGYSGYIYLLEHVPVGKVASYAYVNPVVAVLLGILVLHERPPAEEFAGMAAVILAVFLLTTAQVRPRRAAEHVRQLEHLSTE
jgi:drug/metabolite transporter (DMT)-like permease